MKLSITPKKSLGQNFLINQKILDKIITAAEISEEDTVLEIGPGTGNLTEKLAEKAKKIITVEKDHRLINDLRLKFKNSNIEIVESDILKLKIEALIENYKIVGNIPYYITSNFLRTVFEKWLKPELIVLTIQKEVAQRIMAKPPKMNLLALSVQFFAKPEIISYVSKENFRPRPKVDSAIIKLTPRKKLLTENPENFFKLARAGFSSKRKQLVNSLTQKLGKSKEEIKKYLKKQGIQPKSRPEELNIDKWIKIGEVLG